MTAASDGDLARRARARRSHQQTKNCVEERRHARTHTETRRTGRRGRPQVDTTAVDAAAAAAAAVATSDSGVTAAGASAG